MSKIGDAPKRPQVAGRKPLSTTQSKMTASDSPTSEAEKPESEGRSLDQQQPDNGRSRQFLDLPTELVQHTIGMVGLDKPSLDSGKALARLQQVSKGLRAQVQAHRPAMAVYAESKLAHDKQQVAETNRQLAAYFVHRCQMRNWSTEDRATYNDNFGVIFHADSIEKIAGAFPELVKRMQNATHFNVKGMLDRHDMEKVDPLFKPLLGQLNNVSWLTLAEFPEKMDALRQLPEGTLSKLTSLDFAGHDPRDYDRLDLGDFNEEVKQACAQSIAVGASTLPMRHLKVGAIRTETAKTARSSVDFSFLAAMLDLEQFSLQVPSSLGEGNDWQTFESNLITHLRALPKLTKIELSGRLSDQLVADVCRTLAPRLTELRLRKDGYDTIGAVIDLRTMPKLEAVEIAGPSMSEEWLEKLHLEACPMLTSLTLESLTDEQGPDLQKLGISKLTELTELRLANFHGTSSNVQAMLALPKLEILHLHSGLMSQDAGDLLEPLVNLPSLRRLVLGAQLKFEGKLLHHLLDKVSPALQTLNISTWYDNNFGIREELTRLRQQGKTIEISTLDPFSSYYDEIAVRGEINPMRPFTAPSLPETAEMLEDGL